MRKITEEPTSPSAKPYATDEVEFPVLGKAAVILIVFTIVSSAIAYGAYKVFVVNETAAPAHTLETTPVAPDPNVPMLQQFPLADIHKFRADEYDAERSYSHWKDGDGKSSLRIPIIRAMEIVKSNGLRKPAKSGVSPLPPQAGGVSIGSAALQPNVAPTSPGAAGSTPGTVPGTVPTVGNSTSTVAPAGTPSISPNSVPGPRP
jgi:hypothetical protein